MVTDTGDVERIAARARSRFGAFIHDRVNPGAAGRDRSGAPLARSLYQEAAGIGLLGLSLPREIGGEGLDKFGWGIVVEELGRLTHEPGFTIFLDITVSVADMIVQSGRTDLVDRYARPMAAGLRLGASAGYENRDRLDYRSTARRTAGGWVLDARKPMVTSTALADVFVVYVRDEDSGNILGFLVERDDPGVFVSSAGTSGLRSLGVGGLAVHDLHVADDRLLWTDGLSAHNDYLRGRRMMAAATLCGSMRALADESLRHLGVRHRGGRAVVEFSNVQKTVGEIHVAVETSQAMLHRGLHGLATRADPAAVDLLATITKQFVTEQSVVVAQKIMALFGGQGYRCAYPWERAVRDMLGGVSGSGSQEMLLIQLGQHAINDHDLRRLRMQRLQATVDGLTDSWWATVALASALDMGLIDALATPATGTDLSRRLGADDHLVLGILDVLVALGMVSRDGEKFTADDGIEPYLHGGPQRAALAESLSPAAHQARALATRRDRTRGPDAVALDHLVLVLAQQVDGLDERLHSPDTHVLCAGVDADDLRRALPQADVTEQAPGGALADLALLTPPLSPRLLTTRLRRLRDEVRPGGWVAVLTTCTADADLRGATSRFRGVVTDGHAVTDADAGLALRDAGYLAVETHPLPSHTTTSVTVGRSPSTLRRDVPESR